MQQRPRPQLRVSHSPITRLVLLAIGHVFAGIAVIGILLPLVPTTGPLLVAAACYARASERFYTWLLTNRTFGPTVRDWQEHRVMTRRAKVTSIALIVLTIGSSILFFADHWIVKLVLAIIAVVLITFLARIRTRTYPPQTAIAVDVESLGAKRADAIERV